MIMILFLKLVWGGEGGFGSGAHSNVQYYHLQLWQLLKDCRLQCIGLSLNDADSIIGKQKYSHVFCGSWTMGIIP